MLNKIPAQSGLVNFRNQAQQSEEPKQQNVFSRRADSGAKLFSSLKNLFFRTDKSQAKTVVAQAAPKVPLEPVKAGNLKRVHFESDQRTTFQMANRDSDRLPQLRKSIEKNEVTDVLIKEQSLKDFSEITDKAVEQNSNQSSKPVGDDFGQLDFEKSFRNDFKKAFASALEKMIDLNDSSVNTIDFIGVTVNTAETVLARQMNDTSQTITKQNLAKNIESALNSTFNNDISPEIMGSIMNAVSNSFDFADAEELKKMQAGELR